MTFILVYFSFNSQVIFQLRSYFSSYFSSEIYI